MQVSFENIYKRYGDFVAVNNLNLSIKEGSLHFLLGPSGCGKTTSLRMLAGLEQPSEGTIKIGGKDMTHVGPAERGIGMVFQNYALWPHMSVRKNIEYGLKLKKLSTAEIKSRLSYALSITQLEKFKDRAPNQLSGGQQQRVALARAIAIQPSVLLLDEPLSNLDAKLRLEMRDNILNIHNNLGITMVYVTHDQKEALSMADDVSVMHGGHLIQTGSPKELYHDPRHPFIAKFIGETNLLEGTITKTGDNKGQMFEVNTGIGKIFSHGNDNFNFTQGEKIFVSVRPEAASLASSEIASEEPVHKNGKKLTLPLKRSIYLGESEQLVFELNDTIFRVLLFNTRTFKADIGNSLDIHYDPADVLLLKHETVRGEGT